MAGEERPTEAAPGRETSGRKIPIWDAVVIGAGAAGLMCAAAAGQRGRRVLLLDHAPEPGKKILISGGGRCNFTNLQTVPGRFLSENPHFARSALDRYTPDDFIAMVVRHGIRFHEKTLGQLFCDGSARAIVAMLMKECQDANVAFRFGCRVATVGKPDRFRIDTDHGEIATDSLVLATGGLSIPKLGATGLAHDIARRFGLAVTQARPGLVPLIAEVPDLAGVSFDCEASLGLHRFREAALFTHRGLSGPAILQISNYWREGAISLRLLPDSEPAGLLLDAKRTRPRVETATILAEQLPRRLVQSLPIPEGRIGDRPDRVLRDTAALLRSWPIVPTGTEGYAKAEVTVGGIDTRGLSSKTMESLTVPGLFAIGEAVDVTGWLGGYNFQWAWASGWAAGQAI